MATYISEVEAIQFTGSNFEECKAWFEENIKEEESYICEDDEGRVSVTVGLIDRYLFPDEYLISCNGKFMAMFPEDFQVFFNPKN